MTEIKSNPTVSVIISTYNRAHLIGRAIQSVLDQTYQDFEIIVVDDASTDNTEEVVSNFDDERIRYIRLKENSGTSATPRNTAIKIARGKYIAFQDSDDEWLPEKLKKQIRLFETVFSKVGIIYTDMWRINKNEKKKYWHSPRIMPEDGIIYEEALGYRVAKIGTAIIVIKKECFDKAGLFDEKLSMYIDTELLMRMSKYYYFCHIDEPLVLIPHVTAPAGSNDHKFMCELLQHLGSDRSSIFLLPDKFTAAQTKWVISRMKCMIAARRAKCRPDISRSA